MTLEETSVTDDTTQPRDGLPTPDEIRQAAQLLQIPLDEDRMGVAEMLPERQVTSLLAVLSAWINAYQFVHDIQNDRLTPDQMHMLIVSAQNEVSEDPAATMNAAIWHIQWAGYLVRELGRGHEGNTSNPAVPVEHLLRATASILTTWRNLQNAETGIELDGVQYNAGDGTLVKYARKDVVAALSAINKLMGAS